LRRGGAPVGRISAESAAPAAAARIACVARRQWHLGARRRRAVRRRARLIAGTAAGMSHQFGFTTEEQEYEEDDDDAPTTQRSASVPELRSMSTTLPGKPKMSLIPAHPSPLVATWYTGGSMSSTTRQSWRPLGATWRQWDRDGPGRANPDDGSDHVNGCVPHWGKETGIRLRGVIEHELTWSYYRMRKHEKHPQRQAVGEFLPTDALNEKMRFGRGSQFQFWRDLRPPFYVLDLKRVDDGSQAAADLPAASMSHPDGEMYNITYECAIEYFAERLMDTKSNNGTFNNKVRGVAQVRIPNGFPQKRPMHIVNWGRPTLNAPDTDKMLEDPRKPKSVDPGQWNPLAGELGVPATSDRLAKCRVLSKEVASRLEHRRKIVKVPELQKLLLGAHASLPRLAKMQANLVSPDMSAENSPQPPRLRKHTIYTPATGFVSYAG